MTIYLQHVNLWDVVTQELPDPPTPDWTPKDRYALSIIHNCCDPSHGGPTSEQEFIV